MSKYPILNITSKTLSEGQEIEGGAAEKYWIDLPDIGSAILKIDDESLNGAWVEKVTSELAVKMKLPTARYEFAQLPDGRKAIVSPSYLKPNHQERSGRMLMDRQFGMGKYAYTIERVLETIAASKIELPDAGDFPIGITAPADLFAGYLVFDYWIDNIDRHYENWGIQIDRVTGRRELLPNYDCGLGLGFLLFDEECVDLSPANHNQNQSSAFYNDKNRSLSMDRMLATIYAANPEAVKIWTNKIQSVKSSMVSDIFNRIPNGWISPQKQKC